MPEEKPRCHIHDKAWDAESVRENVCVNEADLIEFDGKHYCLLHLPTKDKDIKKFEEIFKARLKEVEERIAAIEELPEEEREEAKRGISYDFRYVWFPSDINLRYYKFSADAYFISATFSTDASFISTTFSADASFISATFSADASFISTTFSADASFSSAAFSAQADFSSAAFSAHADFSSVKFSADADFSSAAFSVDAFFSKATFSADAFFSSVTFSADAYFRSAIFSAAAYFSSATFSAAAYFSSATFSADSDFSKAAFSADAFFSRATFSADADFSSTTFSASASFSSAKFIETSQVFFRQTRFCKFVHFNYAVFVGYVAFEGDRDEKVFSDKKDEDKKAVLNLQNARLEKPERISFHRVRLCPSWFVNTDPRKMIFTDVFWDNIKVKFRNQNIKAEIKSLEERQVSEPGRLLEIACRQFAVNAEENNRYEEAAEFRRMAMETKRLEYRWQGRLWSLNWWYKWTSSYGESWKWAAVVLLAILFTFAILYTQTNFQVCPAEKTEPPTPCETRPLYFGEAARHSLATAAFQNVEHRKPSSGLGETFIILEKIFAPLQAALLALAIRRKFMR